MYVTLVDMQRGLIPPPPPPLKLKTPAEFHILMNLNRFIRNCLEIGEQPRGRREDAFSMLFFYELQNFLIYEGKYDS